MIKYKIDRNRYHSENWPVALYVKRWPGFWQHLESFQTKEDAQASYQKFADKVTGLPVYLNGHSR